MFDVGFTEILMIGVVALVVIGPERLPAVAKTAGQWIGKLQRFVRGVKTDLASELQSGDLKKLIGDQREQINELKNMVSSAKKDFEINSRDFVQGARKSLGELESSVKELDDKVASEQGKAGVELTKPELPESDSGSRKEASAVSVKAIESPSKMGRTENSTAVVEGDNRALAASELVEKPTPSSTDDGSHDTSTMRTDSSGSLDDSADRGRTGTESGS